jgi:hypothetical protein
MVGSGITVLVRKASAEVAVGCPTPGDPEPAKNSAIITNATMGTSATIKAQPRKRGLSPDVNHHQVRVSPVEPGLPAAPFTGDTSNRERC